MQERNIAPREKVGNHITSITPPLCYCSVCTKPGSWLEVICIGGIEFCLFFYDFPYF